MKRYLSRLLTNLKNSRKRGVSRTASRQARLQVETLEGRTLPSVNPLVPDWATGFTNPQVQPDGTDITFVQRLYGDLLHRTADFGGLLNWLEKLRTMGREQVAEAIFNSPEAHRDEVIGVYRAYLNRAPEADGLNNWAHQLDAGADLSVVRAGILSSDEFFAKSGGTLESWYSSTYRALFPDDVFIQEVGFDHPIPPIGLTNSNRFQAVKDLTNWVHFDDTDITPPFYQYFLHREGETAGVTGWNQALSQGGLTEAKAVGGFTGSQEYYSTANPDASPIHQYYPEPFESVKLL